jgi:hypothetical protein
MAELELIHRGGEIWTAGNALSPELCRQIVARFEKDDRKRYGKNEEGQLFDNRQGRLLKVSRLSEWRDLDQAIFEAVGRVLQAYFRAYRFSISFSDEGYEVGCYLPGEGCKEHFDYGNRLSRVASLLFYLNDVEDGGETVFPRQGIAVHPETGSALLFPPFHTHPHLANPPVTGPRYFLVTWANAIQNLSGRLKSSTG